MTFVPTPQTDVFPCLHARDNARGRAKAYRQATRRSINGAESCLATIVVSRGVVTAGMLAAGMPGTSTRDGERHPAL